MAGTVNARAPRLRDARLPGRQQRLGLLDGRQVLAFWAATRYWDADVPVVALEG